MSNEIQPLDRARRQLSEAVWLFFETRDPLVIETLAEEARENLRELLETPHEEVRARFLAGYLKDEHHDAAADYLGAASGEIELEALLFDALTLYLSLAREWILEAAAFFSWMQLEKTEWFRPEVLSTEGIEARRGERAFFLAFLKEALENGDDDAKLGRHVPGSDE